MRLLITGGEGFTGLHLVASAQAAGHSVTVLRSDLLNLDALRKEVYAAEPEVVIHLAGLSFVGHSDVNAFYEVNVIGTLNLLASLAALPRKPKQVLLASSANVYGNCEVSPISENQVPAPVNHYAMSKLAMEHMAKTYLDRLPLFFVRPFNYTGVGQIDSFLIPKLVLHFAKKSKFIELGNLDVEREFNDVRFVCSAYLKLLTQAVPGEVYNICSGNPMTLRSIIALLQELTGHTMEIKVNPKFVRANEIYRLYGDSNKLKRTIELGSIPTIADTLQWMLKQKTEENSC